MEINYTNFELNPKVFGTNCLSGLIDIDSQYLYNNVYDIRSLQYNENLTVTWFLKFGANRKNKKIIFEMLSEFEISEELQKRKLKTLSESELTKVLIIKACISNAKTIILNYIDSILNWRDLNTVLKTIKNHLVEIEKNVIFSTNKIDNIILHSDKYIIVKNNEIIYNGNDITELPIDTEINEFVKLANKKGAKLDYYKEANDLLKAIYRSIKK